MLLRRRSLPLNSATLRFPNVMLGATSWIVNAGALYRILVGGMS
jgi:hypothetical protein